MVTDPAPPLHRTAAAETHSGARGAWGAAAVAAGARRRRVAQTAARLRGGVWALFDALLVSGAVIGAHALSPLYAQSPVGPAARRAALVYAAAFLLVGFGVGLYDRSVWRARRLIGLRALAASGLAAAATLGFHYLVFYAPIGRRVSAASLALALPLSVLPRLLLWEFLRRLPRRLLFVGDDALQRRTRALLAADPNHNYEVAGVCASAAGVELAELCHDEEVDELLLPLRAEQMQPLLGAALLCVPLGCRVRSVADFYEDVFRSVPVRDVTPQWLLARGWDSSDHLAEALKRVSDVLLAGLLLVLSAPLVALAALAQRLSEGGPVFYSQVRVGRYGRPFRIHKLRSMRVDAEAGGPSWAARDDPRRTRLGGILRRTRLDELPQLWNILRGDMSFVGPRPERPEFVAELERAMPFYHWRHLVRPGLTGWAQINYPYGAGVEDAERKLEFDLYYLRHLSFVTDLGIVVRTTVEALRGAR